MDMRSKLREQPRAAWYALLSKASAVLCVLEVGVHVLCVQRAATCWVCRRV